MKNNTEAARNEVVAEFADLVGKPGADAVRTVLSAANGPEAPGRVETALSLLVLLFGASGVFANLQDSLDTIWQVKPKPGKRAFLLLIRKRFISFAMVLGICFLLLVSLVISAGLAALRSYAEGRLHTLAWVWTVAHAVISLGVVTVLFAMIYKILPDVTLRWRDVWLGAGLTAILFALGRFAIGTYLGHARVVSSYGAAGSLVALLVWVYFSAQILYLGAEFTKAYSRAIGERIKPESLAVRTHPMR